MVNVSCHGGGQPSQPLHNGLVDADRLRVGPELQVRPGGRDDRGWRRDRPDVQNSRHVGPQDQPDGQRGPQGKKVLR